MNTNEYLWIPLNTIESLRTPLNTIESLRIPLNTIQNHKLSLYPMFIPRCYIHLRWRFFEDTLSLRLYFLKAAPVIKEVCYFAKNLLSENRNVYDLQVNFWSWKFYCTVCREWNIPSKLLASMWFFRCWDQGDPDYSSEGCFRSHHAHIVTTRAACWCPLRIPQVVKQTVQCPS